MKSLFFTLLLLNGALWFWRVSDRGRSKEVETELKVATIEIIVLKRARLAENDDEH